MTPKHYIIVEHRNQAAYDAALREVARLKEELQRQKRAYFDLERRFGEEVVLNVELVDLLKLHHIQFRQLLDHRVRESYNRGK